MADIDRVKDDGVYGLFPAFVPFIDAGELVWCGAMLSSLERQQVEEIVAMIPQEWQVEQDARAALVELIVRRASYLTAKLDKGWRLM